MTNQRFTENGDLPMSFFSSSKPSFQSSLQEDSPQARPESFRVDSELSPLESQESYWLERVSAPKKNLAVLVGGWVTRLVMGGLCVAFVGALLLLAYRYQPWLVVVLLAVGSVFWLAWRATDF
jgi:hypothetical protein